MAELWSRITGSRNFDKFLMAFLFIATVFLCVHLIHKSDAGGDDANFIGWAESMASGFAGSLITMVKTDSGAPTTSPTTPPEVPKP